MPPRNVVLVASSCQLAVKQKQKTGWAEFWPTKKTKPYLEENLSRVHLLSVFHNSVPGNTIKHVKSCPSFAQSPTCLCASSPIRRASSWGCSLPISPVLETLPQVPAWFGPSASGVNHMSLWWGFQRPSLVSDSTTTYTFFLPLLLLYFSP